MTEINYENLQISNSKTDDEIHRNLFKFILQKFIKKDREIIQPTNRIEDLQQRVLEQERCFSKDSFNFYNVPIDKNVGLEESMLQLLYD